MAIRSPLLLLAALAGLAVGPAGALAGPTDVATTKAYIQANYALVQSAKAHLASFEAAPVGILGQVERECPLAAASSPQDPESTQLSNEVIGAMVIAAYRLDLPAMRAFIGTVARLHWSNGRLTSAVRAYADEVRTLTTLAAPGLCADVRAWAASGFHALPASAVRFEQRFMPAWVALGELPSQLTAYERPEERQLLNAINRIEVELTNAEARAVETWRHIMIALALNP